MKIPFSACENSEVSTFRSSSPVQVASLLGRKSVQKTAQLQSSEVRRTAAPQSSMTLPAGNTFGRGMIGPVTSMRQLYTKKKYFFSFLKEPCFALVQREPSEIFARNIGHFPHLRRVHRLHRPEAPPSSRATRPQGHKATELATWVSKSLPWRKKLRQQSLHKFGKDKSNSS